MSDDQFRTPALKTDLPALEWRSVLRSALSQMKVDRVSVAAGAFAYRWFLAIFPIIIALLGIAKLVTIPRNVVVSLIHGVTKSLPSGAAQVFAVDPLGGDLAQLRAVRGADRTETERVMAMKTHWQILVVDDEEVICEGCRRGPPSSPFPSTASTSWRNGRRRRVSLFSMSAIDYAALQKKPMGRVSSGSPEVCSSGRHAVTWP